MTTSLFWACPTRLLPDVVTMPDDIERFTPAMRGRIAYEHRHRYAVCLPYLAGLRVLDVACGEGYGSIALGRVANEVVGADLNKEVVSAAAKRYRRKRNVRFEVANCGALPFNDASFDAVVSMETLEHLSAPEQVQFLQEIKRVMRGDGLLFLSTPNREIYSRGSERPNPFHKNELSKPELLQLLRRFFGFVQLFGQRFYIPSMIGPLAEDTSGSASEKSDTQTPASAVLEKSLAITEPQYYLAICSETSDRVSHFNPSLFIDEKDDLWLEQEAVLQWAARLHNEDEELRAHLRQKDVLVAELQRNLQQERSQQNGLRAQLSHQIEQLSSDNESLKRALKATRQTLAPDAAEKAAGLTEPRYELDPSDLRKPPLESQVEALYTELQSSAQRVQYYSSALQQARSDVKELEERLEKQARDYARAKALAERLEAELAKLKEESSSAAHAVEVRLNDLHSELLAEQRSSQAAKQEAAALADRLSDAEVTLRINEGQISSLNTELFTLRQKATLAERLQREIAAVTAERTTLTRKLAKVDAELAASVANVRDQADALRKAEELASQHNVRLSALLLRESTLREMSVAAKTARRRIGQAPLGLSFENGQLRSSLWSRSEPRRKHRAEWKAVAQSGLFDAHWYLAHNPDVALAGIDPFAHFMAHGIVEGRDPHPLFSSGWYRIQMHRSSAPTDVPPLLHYLAVGRAQRASPHPLFSAEYYIATNRDVAESGMEPLHHFLTLGAGEWRDPHPLIRMRQLADQIDPTQESGNVLIEYLGKAQFFGASPHPLFDGTAYLAENRDVARAGVNPLMHYCAIGWRQGRTPHCVFSPDWYLARNPDVLAAEIDPLSHYVRYGAQEYRDPHPLFDIRFYYSRYHESRRLSYDALSDYVLNGLGEKLRETTAKITVGNIRQLVSPQGPFGTPPIAAFLNSDLAIAPPSMFTSEFGPTTYWLPQALRDYIIDRHGEAVINLYVRLMSVVEAYGARQRAFLRHRDFSILNERLRLLAKERHVQGGVDVSIVIPVFNNVLYTLTSVLSLLENDSLRSYEILIGDDCSTDGTTKIFSEAGGCVRLIRHDRNLGFLHNCNRTASHAKGRVIAFLNNDTLLLPGWLDELMDALEETPNAGLVGSKLINADGSLQEAGGILWRDGSAWNFGRNGNPRLPAFNYLKDADYVSGAAIALTTALWRQLGGFDTEFLPAYCEDSDLAFRVRQAGLRTLYTPHAMLIHHEGKSHGRNPDTGTKAHQAKNQRKLIARWKHVLEVENHPNGEHLFVARDRSSQKPHILFIDHYVPQWDRDAGSRTMLHFLRMFVAEGFQVSFWPDNLNEDRAYCAPLQRMGVEVLYGCDDFKDFPFSEFISEAGPHLNYALVSRPHIAIKYYEALRKHSEARILYYGHDIHWRRIQQSNAIATTATEHDILAMRRLEVENWRKADIVLYPSLEEAEFVRDAVAASVSTQVPMLGHLPKEFAVSRANLTKFGDRSSDELLFVGGSHPPNVDALLWFCNEVMPRVLAENPRARLTVVGAMESSVPSQLNPDAVRFVGQINDDELASLYASKGIAIAPLRYGGGVKGKTLEAFLHAIPLVTTSIGMQGIVSDGSLAFVADDAEAFSAAILRAQIDKLTAKAQVEAATRFMETAYSMPALRAAFAAFLPELSSTGTNITPFVTRTLARR